MPTSPSSLKSTARGFEILLMPYDVMKYMASVQTLALGDISTDYGDGSIFLTIEIAEAEAVAQGKEMSSLCITFPSGNFCIGRLKYTEFHKCVVYYRRGDGEENASVWLLSASLPQLELKSKAPNSSWKIIQAYPGADTPERRDALYMRCPKGRQISAEFFNYCELGNLQCGNLDIQICDTFDPQGHLRRGVLANDFLIRIDSETLLKILRDPKSKLKKKRNDSPPPELMAYINSPEQSGIPDQSVPPDSHEGKLTTATSPQDKSPDAKLLIPAIVVSEAESGPKATASEGHILDDPCPGPAGCQILVSLSTSSASKFKTTGSQNLIDFGDDFVGLGNFEQKSWVEILAEELRLDDVTETNPTVKSNCWLDLLKEEFHEVYN
ncbi:hypothetical protein AOL_s00170g110 [Orbilia oligospora ATCC 24927]|uniref:Uncharacterized protein n=1 Tax=Arthrobotrys oligospora (strain ATCC 24927 / CBS 115.81 / DSM 1491) TaxID=756982 RepID=G1XNE4_ARTOA|nr:hypothetical protein AOL_s00170g110 [Orbilia oligospora ATCC 24927]EGX45403.1 hypothetical protein AOL_s00170g110 [Orbilia oligospora ATCC 24927]